MVIPTPQTLKIFKMVNNIYLSLTLLLLLTTPQANNQANQKYNPQMIQVCRYGQDIYALLSSHLNPVFQDPSHISNP